MTAAFSYAIITPLFNNSPGAPQNSIAGSRLAGDEKDFVGRGGACGCRSKQWKSLRRQKQKDDEGMYLALTSMVQVEKLQFEHRAVCS